MELSVRLIIAKLNAQHLWSRRFKVSSPNRLTCLRTADLHRHALLRLNSKIVIETYDTVNLGFRNTEAVSKRVEALSRYAAECGLYAMETGKQPALYSGELICPLLNACIQNCVDTQCYIGSGRRPPPCSLLLSRTPK